MGLVIMGRVSPCLGFEPRMQVFAHMRILFFYANANLQTGCHLAAHAEDHLLDHHTMNRTPGNPRVEGRNGMIPINAFNPATGVPFDGPTIGALNVLPVITNGEFASAHREVEPPPRLSHFPRDKRPSDMLDCRTTSFTVCDPEPYFSAFPQ